MQNSKPIYVPVHSLGYIRILSHVLRIYNSIPNAYDPMDKIDDHMWSVHSASVGPQTT